VQLLNGDYEEKRVGGQLYRIAFDALVL